LRIVIVVLGVVAAAAILLRLDSLRFAGQNTAGRFRNAAAAAVVVVSLLAGGLGTAAWTLATAATAHSGSIPTSGPSGSAMGGFGNRAGGFGAAGGAGQAGGPGSEGTSDAGLTALLKSTTTKWSAIVSGATQAASLELATNTNVIALGGWNGGDPYPTLAEFQDMVAKGQIGYYIAGGGMGGGGFGGQGGNSEVASWVQANFQAQTVGNSTVYKLTK
jgi:hypothetical protein